jgi:hypothetical protein
MKGRDHLEDLEVEWISFKLISIYGVRELTGFIWLVIETSVGLL